MSTTPTTTTTPQPFTGNVSAQAAAGEAVTLQITRPDGTLATAVTAVTDGNGNFSGTFTDTVPDQDAQTYSAAFSIAADATYTAASVTVTYTISAGLLSRTLTATIGNTSG